MSKNYLKKFEDNSVCIVDEDVYFLQVNESKHLRLGRKLGFIQSIILTDGTVYQNMHAMSDMNIPTPGAIAELLKDFGAACNYKSEVK